MLNREEARRRLERLFRRKPIADLATIQRILDTTSRTTVFRVLSEIGYLTSYSHAGRYYTLQEIPHFGAEGLWSHGEVLFSTYRTLRATITQFVKNAPAGQTHGELRDRLRLRVHDTLRQLAQAKQIGRVPFEHLFVYVSAKPTTARAQQIQRRRLLESTTPPVLLPPLAVIIEVLLDVIHNARTDPAGVVARLSARNVIVTLPQVQEVFRRHGLEKKTARRPSRRSKR